MYAIKTFRVNKKGEPCFLFHGRNGSTVMPRDKWVKAERKMVRDGSGKTWYESGFHAFPSIEAFNEWRKSVRHEYVWCIVELKGLRKKSHSKHDVILANQMRLTSTEWNGRLSQLKDGSLYRYGCFETRWE